jgi:group II intron reverse transcriptase/maturase
MQTKLNLIIAKAKQDKRAKFTSLAHLINEENLAKCYSELKRNKACGIDEMTVQEYGENLKERLNLLVEAMKSKRYQPQPVKRVYIPKAGTDEKRGLGIPTIEDKLVQIMLKKILESIYETNFQDCSYGFRPNRSCHQAVNALDKAVMRKPVNFIVEVDIRKFFDNVQHDWMVRCLEERVKDPNILWLIKRVLKAGSKSGCR